MPEFVVNPWINPNTIEKRDYQENIVATAIKFNTLCVIPTGLGKTAAAIGPALSHAIKNDLTISPMI